MPDELPAQASEFLSHYAHDAQQRWATEDHTARQTFVEEHLAGWRWTDWSTERILLELAQAPLVAPGFGAAERIEALLLAGPVVELVSPQELFDYAAAHVGPGARVVGLAPCLQDNSPESQLFMDVARTLLWPYYTAEEMLEMFRGSGWETLSPSTRFVAVPAFTQAVQEGRLRFGGFKRVFTELEREGYDPAEVGWGDLYFVGRFA
jgi:hypothetical protein